ncbi:ketopantoate reductase family protein [Saccharibacillus alkalitolerans]|uniref:2-dehydropantoate 2-reductase n=1 Tax=Saccharibacillus alkalitolerans TaxID=2705290 RepID=A0ABX0F008_9BACL|nr:ketopantoate reductase family protein [Saccharibacillus alkalitolerans]NGZ73865.1 ketopantoate reductase family protein [Saccharibacillus alkalitolerans]
MRIEVIGGGALGLLFAARAAAGGTATVLYARTEEQARLVSGSGIEVRNREEEAGSRVGPPELEALPVRRFGLSCGETSERWVVLAVKQKDLDESLVARLREGMRPGDRLLCLQNGTGHLERLGEALPGVLIYAGITTEGARRLGPDSVLHAGKGTTLIGIPDTKGERPRGEQEAAEKKLENAFAAAGLSLSASNEIETVMYRKLLINAVINPLTAIWRIENGALLDSEPRLAVMRALFDEVTAVYSAAGIGVSDSWWEDLLGVCRATARNRSSMLEDVSRGRETEAKWISGGIADLARRAGLEAPMNRTLLGLITGMN